MGCETYKDKSIYYWANYEPLVYSGFIEPEEIPTEEKIQVLKEDIKEAEPRAKPLPPGFYAHLGQLYVEAEEFESALSTFKTEKELFPESTVFMDRLIANIRRNEVL